MKKISFISLLSAIVLIIGAIVLNVLGFTYINGTHVVRQYGGFMQMTYYTSSMSNVSLAMIIAGGFLFLGGILLLMLAALTCGHKCQCKHEEKKPEAVKVTAAPEPEPEPQPECCEQETTEEQNQ